MKVDILASGSKGNCIALTVGVTTILIDAGIPKTKIESRLLEVGIRADQVAAIFVTHAHGDHIKGLPLANKYRIPVHASFGEWKDISKKLNIDAGLHRVIDKDVIELINEIDVIHVQPFNVHHDALQPKAYVVESPYNKCSVCLDTGHIDDEMINVMTGSDTYIIEANHHPPLVEVCERPPSIIARILSNEVGHLSNDQTADALSKLVTAAGERIYLTHLSEGNNLPSLAKMTAENRLMKKGFKNGEHYFLEVIE